MNSPWNWYTPFVYPLEPWWAFEWLLSVGYGERCFFEYICSTPCLQSVGCIYLEVELLIILFPWGTANILSHKWLHSVTLPLTMLKNSCCIPTNYFLVFDHSHVLRCEVASHCAAYLTLNYMKMFVDNMILYFLLGNLHNWHRHIILNFFLPFFRTFCDLAISICDLHSFKLPYSISLDK